MTMPYQVAEIRRDLCRDCACDVDPELPCSRCPKNLWREHHSCAPGHNLPALRQQAASLVRSTVQWAKSGFAATPEPELQQRLDTCKSCEFWDATGFGNTGRCQKCGCSTWAKLRMATSKCPVGKWPSTSSGRGPSASSGSGTGLQ